MRECEEHLEFVYLTTFERSIQGLADEEDLRWLEWILIQEPRLGAVVPGWGGARKLRIPSHGRGKRGGGRVIYLYVQVRCRIYFLVAYGKNQRDDLSPQQQAAVQKLVEILRMEAG